MSNFAPYPDNKVYQQSLLSRSTGLTPLDMFMTMKLGNSMLPFPQPGTNQNLVDAFLVRQRTLDFYQTRNNALANSLLVQKLGGVNPANPMFQMASGMLGDPDGMVARVMSPLIGGNPMRAQMGLYANLTAGNMSTFGRPFSVSVGDTDRQMQKLYNSFYHHNTINSDYLRNSRASILGSARGLFGANDPRLSEVTGLFDNNSRVDSGGYNFLLQRNQALKQLQGVVGDTKMSNEDMQKQKEAIAGAYSDNRVKKAIEDAFAAATKKEGKERVDEIERIYKVNSMNNVLTGLDTHMGNQNNFGKSIAQYIDFANTRGFKLEDFTQAFSSAAGAKLFRGKNLENAENAFFGKTGAGVLDAARGIYGNDKSGRELMDLVSDMLGSSFVDMGSASDSTRLEDFLRKVKSAASVADVSVETILSTIETGKRLAANYPGLQHLGGIELGNMAVSSLATAQAQANTLSNDYVRRNGGMPGLVEQQMAARLNSAAQPITKQLSAAYHYFSNVRGDQQTAALISQYATSPNYNHQDVGFNAFIGGIAGRAGLTPLQLISYTRNNTEAQALGLRANPDLAQSADLGAREMFEMMLYSNSALGGGAKFGRSELARLRKYLSGASVNVGEYMAGAYSSDSNKVTKGLADQLQETLSSIPGMSIAGFAGLDSADQENTSPAARKLFANLQANLNNRLYNDPGSRGLLRNSVVSSAPDLSYITTAFPLLANNPEAMQFLRQYGTSIGNSALRGSSSIYRNYERDITARIRQRSLEDKELSSRYGHVNAPMTTSFFNKLLDGSLDRDGLSALLAPMRLEKDDSMYIDVQRKAYAIAGLRSATSLQQVSGMTKDILGHNIIDGDLHILGQGAGKLNAVLKGKGIAGAGNANELYRLIASLPKDQRKARLNGIAADLGKDGKAFLEAASRAGMEAANPDINVATMKALGIDSSYAGDFNINDIKSALARQGIRGIKDSILNRRTAEIESSFKSKLDGIMGTKPTSVEDRDVQSKLKALQTAARDAGMGTDSSSLYSILYGAGKGTSAAELKQITAAQENLAGSLGIGGNLTPTQMQERIKAAFNGTAFKPFTEELNDAKGKRDRADAAINGESPQLKSIETTLDDILNAVSGKSGKSVVEALNELTTQIATIASA